MSLKSALAAGLAIAAVCAGCATSTGYVAGSAVDSAVEGYASPSTWDVREAYRFGGCSGGGTYNRATGLCVSEGVE
jgi:hypothetical protein